MTFPWWWLYHPGCQGWGLREVVVKAIPRDGKLGDCTGPSQLEP